MNTKCIIQYENTEVLILLRVKTLFEGGKEGSFLSMLQMIELCITDKLDYKNKTFPAQIKVLITDMTILQ